MKITSAPSTRRLSESVNGYLERAGFKTHGHNITTSYGSFYINVIIENENKEDIKYLKVRISDHNPARSGDKCDLYLYNHDNTWISQLYEFIKENNKKPCRHLKRVYTIKTNNDNIKRLRKQGYDCESLEYKKMIEDLKNEYQEFLKNNGFLEDEKKALAQAEHVDNFKKLSRGSRKSVRRNLRLLT